MIHYNLNMIVSYVGLLIWLIAVVIMTIASWKLKVFSPNRMTISFYILCIVQLACVFSSHFVMPYLSPLLYSYSGGNILNRIWDGIYTIEITSLTAILILIALILNRGIKAPELPIPPTSGDQG